MTTSAAHFDRLYLITHAHTRQIQDVNARSWDLSATGREQARLLAAQPWWLQVDLIALSSEFKTALTVADVQAVNSLPTVVDSHFDELHRGGWVDDYGERVRSAFAQPAESAGGWEPAAAALERFRTGLRTLVNANRGRTVALVSHGMMLSLYRADLLGLSHVCFEDWRALSFAAVALVDPVAKVMLEDFTPVGDPQPRA